MSSFKLVVLWGDLKVRNLRLSLSEGIEVHLEDRFFPFSYSGTGILAKLSIEVLEKPSSPYSVFSNLADRTPSRQTGIVSDDKWRKIALRQLIPNQLIP